MLTRSVGAIINEHDLKSIIFFSRLRRKLLMKIHLGKRVIFITNFFKRHRVLEKYLVVINEYHVSNKLLSDRAIGNNNLIKNKTTQRVLRGQFLYQ